jgi:hypothetical protein
MAVHLGVALSGPFPRIVDLAAMPFSARAYNPLAAGMPFPRLVDLDLLGFPSSCTLQGYSIVGVGGLQFEARRRDTWWQTSFIRRSPSRAG